MKDRARGFLLALVLAAPPAQAFDFTDVAVKARALAAKPYEAPDVRLPRDLAALDYDQYRHIRFKPELSMWRGDKRPFELQFFHPGLFFKQPVAIHLVTAAGVRRLRFDPDAFDYGPLQLDREGLEALDYAGFRVHYPLNRKDYKDELVVFQGASYFRALGKGQRYGLSARGLSIDTGLMSGEEFPAFKEFWIEWPRPEDRELTLYALLDSPRAAGAYRFKLRPGDATVMDVRMSLYLRDAVGKLGIAPLTSMYFFGENQPATVADYRPEVHDSDGLMLQTDGEWLWRPLVNPRRLLITSFSAINPRGFGLLQRDRNFAHYEDLEARYDLRPSAWVTPKGDWGAGRVELVQIPTPDETNDNIVAYWVPERAPPPGEALDLEYQIAWRMRADPALPLARVVQTRRGHGYVRQDDGSLRFHVDFEGGALFKLPADAKIVSGVWVGDNGELLERQVYRNEATGGWRLSLRVRRADPERPVEMRAFLQADGETASETWSYILPAEPQ